MTNNDKDLQIDLQDIEHAVQALGSVIETIKSLATTHPDLNLNLPKYYVEEGRTQLIRVHFDLSTLARKAAQ